MSESEKKSFRRANDRIEQLRTKPAIAETVREFAAEPGVRRGVGGHS
mgnify:CR=1 FL=1